MVATSTAKCSRESVSGRYAMSIGAAVLRSFFLGHLAEPLLACLPTTSLDRKTRDLVRCSHQFSGGSALPGRFWPYAAYLGADHQTSCLFDRRGKSSPLLRSQSLATAVYVGIAESFARLRAAPHTFVCPTLARTAGASARTQSRFLLWQACVCIEYVKRVLVLPSKGVLVRGEVARAWGL